MKRLRRKRALILRIRGELKVKCRKELVILAGKNLREESFKMN